MKRQQDLWRNLCIMATVAGFKMTPTERLELCAVVDKLDNEQKVLKVQTLREYPLTLEEYLIFARQLMERHKTLTKSNKVVQMMQSILLKRWASWQIQAARSQGTQYISDESGMQLGKVHLDFAGCPAMDFSISTFQLRIPS